MAAWYVCIKHRLTQGCSERQTRTHTLHNDQTEKLYCYIIIVTGTSVGVCGSASLMIASSWLQCLNKEFVRVWWGCARLPVSACLKMEDTLIRLFRDPFRQRKAWRTEATSSIARGRGERDELQLNPLKSRRECRFISWTPCLSVVVKIHKVKMKVFLFESLCEQGLTY